MRRVCTRLLLAGLLGLTVPVVLAAEAPRVKPGIDVLEARGFDLLRGKRVGLLTHVAGRNAAGMWTVDVLRYDSRVDLVALFAPEHGLYGTAKANEYVPSTTDTRTGLPLHSLYSKTRKPNAEMLAGIDVLVIDLQDVGVRSYTYVSAMRLSIEACFEQGVEVVVLDRPNPLGGLKVDGPPLEKRWMSYVGAYRVPYVHGLTIGELARMAKGETGWLEVPDKVRRQGRLTVVPMDGWQRRMQWPETGIDWTPTSPAIPDEAAVLGYAMTGLGAQLGGFTHGYGTTAPFRLLRYPGKSPAELAADLNALGLPGMVFAPSRAVDTRGNVLGGVYVTVTDWRAFEPTRLSFEMMRLACRYAAEAGRPNPFAAASEAEGVLFNKHVGSTAWWEEITTKGAAADVDVFFARWQQEAERFQQHSRCYWLYAP